MIGHTIKTAKISQRFLHISHPDWTLQTATRWDWLPACVFFCARFFHAFLTIFRDPKNREDKNFFPLGYFFKPLLNRDMKLKTRNLVLSIFRNFLPMSEIVNNFLKLLKNDIIPNFGENYKFLTNNSSYLLYFWMNFNETFGKWR